MPPQAPATTDEFVSLVRRTGLLPNPAPDLSDLPDAPDKAAGELVRRKLLTPFQARMLLAGRSRGFILGDYVIRDQIGQGGMGFVYLGVHRTLGRKAAVKVLPPSIAGDQLARQRFLREARTAAALDHPNVVKLYDVARDEDVWYLVMEYVEGETLEHLVKRVGPLHFAQAAQYVAQAAAGLQHAHEKGFIHRDIKPGNLILTPEGAVKILDMGLARPVGPEGILTVAMDPGALIGTADYISPEQVVSDPDIDIRADIYCLGLTFFFLVTGRPPFEGSTAGKLVKQKLAELPSLADLVEDFPPELAAVVDGMTAKERDERYETPADVIVALKPWLERSAKLMAGVSGTQAAYDRLSSDDLRADEAGEPEPEKKKGPVWVWAVVGGVIFALFAGGTAVAVAMMTKNDPGRPVATYQRSAPPEAPPPPEAPILYSAGLVDITPFEEVLTDNAGRRIESKGGEWTARAGMKGDRARVFATADGLGTQAEVGSAVLSAPVQELKVPTVKVAFEYRSSVADKKLDLRVTGEGSTKSEVRPLAPTGGRWRAVEYDIPTANLKSARFEFHNQDTGRDAKFEMRKFVIRGPR